MKKTQRQARTLKLSTRSEKVAGFVFEDQVASLCIRFSPDQGLLTRKMLIQDSLRPLGEIEIVSQALHRKGFFPPVDYPNDHALVMADYMEVGYYLPAPPDFS